MRWPRTSVPRTFAPSLTSRALDFSCRFAAVAIRCRRPRLSSSGLIASTTMVVRSSSLFVDEGKMANPDSKARQFGRTRGFLYWILTHRHARLILPPLILLCLFALLLIPLLKDLYIFSQDDFFVVSAGEKEGTEDDNLILNVKEINPNNGV